MAYLKTVDLKTEADDGTGAIGVSMAVPTNSVYRIHSVTCKFDTAPTTSENFTITWDKAAGSLYDVLPYTLDPSVGATTSILWQPDNELVLQGDDQIDVAYNNTDGRTWGVEITAEST